MSVAEQPYHHGSLRQVLLARAESTLEQDGVDGISLRRLAREAGVSHAAPSKHFRDRQALLDALAESGFVRLTAALARAVEEADPHARARFGALAGAYVSFALAHRELLALMYGNKHAPGAAPRVVAAGHAAMDLTVRIVTEAQAAGDIGGGDASRIALVAFATFHGIATLAAGGMLDGAPVDEVVTAASDTFWRGLGPRTEVDSR
ncbi:MULTISPECIES: TetR/AcrR family transcriptional regulator [Rhodococcus]|uniref:TetR/AcrR family transcriptional regulator n=1 Tax=Rhodococcus oxybenzonivorans TaxID=1990687 RepID=A0AAE5A438_9NOCA|nr:MULTISPECIES: TetR/AcrR family transcriptional regulator [Rhodococcus]MDV7244113.1 TetR/AcrR family transcriptional regulator [Rhodococcus oxybenzonivorans]MDV7263106.1 TetR/AcrR family transcriptional regulator [Rhodococcus oxybenzonivorans]MDV7274645.1 TetR/AcrR family transcriptional regulator [Rhodococcus oxybenzonivorans]MDV7335958.1 TetR/AcrR family transcriptional regulator [Rhodococcus oxybenzonivorans]MDV7345595.1 TetR/AcrR family transcriptional regulator [Rhodococcus oxybenzonivo